MKFVLLVKTEGSSCVCGVEEVRRVGRIALGTWSALSATKTLCKSARTVRTYSRKPKREVKINIPCVYMYVHTVNGILYAFYIHTFSNIIVSKHIAYN